MYSRPLGYLLRRRSPPGRPGQEAGFLRRDPHDDVSLELNPSKTPIRLELMKFGDGRLGLRLTLVFLCQYTNYL